MRYLTQNVLPSSSINDDIMPFVFQNDVPVDIDPSKDTNSELFLLIFPQIQDLLQSLGKGALPMFQKRSPQSLVKINMPLIFIPHLVLILILNFLNLIHHGRVKRKRTSNLHRRNH